MSFGHRLYFKVYRLELSVSPHNSNAAANNGLVYEESDRNNVQMVGVTMEPHNHTQWSDDDRGNHRQSNIN